MAWVNWSEQWVTVVNEPDRWLSESQNALFASIEAKFSWTWVKDIWSRIGVILWNETRLDKFLDANKSVIDGLTEDTLEDLYQALWSPTQQVAGTITRRLVRNPVTWN